MKRGERRVLKLVLFEYLEYYGIFETKSPLFTFVFKNCVLEIQETKEATCVVVSDKKSKSLSLIRTGKLKRLDERYTLVMKDVYGTDHKLILRCDIKNKEKIKYFEEYSVLCDGTFFKIKNVIHVNDMCVFLYKDYVVVVPALTPGWLVL